MEKYSVRFFRDGDEKEIVKLLEIVFDGWPHLKLDCSALDHWRWKYLGNPLKILLVGVGVADEKMIGCFHVLPVRLKVLQKVILGQIGADLAVHPDYRSVGVSTKIRDMCREQYYNVGFQHTYFITGNPILIRSYMKSRPSFPHTMVNMVRIKDINKHLKVLPVKHSLLMSYGYRMAKIVNNVRNAFSAKKPNRGINILAIERFDEDIEAFWGSVSQHYDFIVERRREYLNWRFCDKRGGEFTVKLAKEGDEILGYIVLCINRYLDGYPIGYVVDLLTLPERMDAAEALIVDAVDFFNDAGVNIVIHMTARGHPYQEAFRRRGFLDSRMKIHLFYNTFGEVNELAKIGKSLPSRVFFSWGDLDELPVRPFE